MSVPSLVTPFGLLAPAAKLPVLFMPESSVWMELEDQTAAT
jgi:hypothetical protein